MADRRILHVTTVPPWPQASGAQIRVGRTVAGLAEAGDVDLLTISPGSRPGAKTVPIGEPVRHWVEVGRPPPGPKLVRLLDGAVRRVPNTIAGRHHRSLRREVAALLPGPYDLVWFGQVEAFTALQGLHDAPAVCDFPDLEDRKLDLKRHLVTRNGWRASMERLRLAEEARRWRHTQRRVGERTSYLVVCSPLDRDRLGLDGVKVIPNVYPAPAHPCGRPGVGDPPTLTMVGLLSYGPNLDAARHLVEVIMPLVWARLPEVRVHLVGRYDERAQPLAADRRVLLTGLVPHIEDELRLADVTVVPIRVGSGTRLKILEAFAHRIPVVSTTAGADGLDVEHDRHLLLADDAADFSTACLRLLSDTDARARLTSAAQALWAAAYSDAALTERVAALARRLSSGPIGTPTAGQPTE